MARIPVTRYLVAMPRFPISNLNSEHERESCRYPGPPLAGGRATTRDLSDAEDRSPSLATGERAHGVCIRILTEQ